MSDTNPITDRDEILASLRTLDEGDEVTVWTDFETYNDTVTEAGEDALDLGELDSQRHRVIDLDGGRLCRVTDDAMNPVTVGDAITKLVVWD
jgi:hypothetical protein